jgi:site-specific recombinase XerD
MDAGEKTLRRVFFLFLLHRERKRKNALIFGDNMSRNFGWGSRDMQDAGRMAMQESEMGKSTIATHSERFGQFASYAKDQGIGRMERITPGLVEEYGQQLSDKVEAGEMSPAYAQNLVSSINSVMSASTRGNWQSISPTKQCNISERSAIRDTPTISRDIAEKGIQNLKDQNMGRQAAVASLALELGLRSKEGSLLNAKSALNQAQTQNTVSILDGTKGGRAREVPITNQGQIDALKSAAQVQGEARSVMPSEENWKSWREGGLRDGREALQNTSGGGFHELRSSYASERYERLTGHSTPCNGGQIENKFLDREVRLQIAQELGHNRIEVVAEYVGGRK